MNIADKIGGVEYLEAGIDQLSALIDGVVAKHTKWNLIQQTRGGIAAWEVGLDHIFE